MVFLHLYEDDFLWLVIVGTVCSIWPVQWGGMKYGVFFSAYKLAAFNENTRFRQIISPNGSCDFTGPKKVSIHGPNRPRNEKKSARKNNARGS